MAELNLEVVLKCNYNFWFYLLRLSIFLKFRKLIVYLLDNKPMINMYINGRLVRKIKIKSSDDSPKI